MGLCRSAALKQHNTAIIQVGEKAEEHALRLIKEYSVKGYEVEWYYYPEDITYNDLKCEIEDLFPHVAKMIMAKPLPLGFDEMKIDVLME